MDMIHKNSRKEQSEFLIISDEIKYQGLLELIDERIQITLILGLSQFKWCGIFSFEQLQKLSAVFQLCNSIEKSFEYFKEILKSQAFKINRDGQKIVLAFSNTYFNIPVTYNILLTQEEISTNDALSTINYSILEMQKEIEDLKIISKGKDEAINSYKNEIEDLRNEIRQIKEENLKQINEIQKNLLPTFREHMYSEILTLKDIDRIGSWIHEGKKKIELKLIYRATTDGFETSKFYEKTSNIVQTLTLVKTKNNNKRFGCYSDLILKNSGGQWIPSNNNQIFLFSLDLDKKYTLNEEHKANAFNGSNGSFQFGGDLYIYNNSNTCSSNQVNTNYFGKKENKQGFEMNSGIQYFLTSEIEVYQVILN